MRLLDKTYDKFLVDKAVHIFRNPLDDDVARFHGWRFTIHVLLFQRNDGLSQLVCAGRTKSSHYIDSHLRGILLQIPCVSDFYRYTPWDNVAFEATRAMNLTPIVLHYCEFSANFEAARGHSGRSRYRV
jgi:hypothetical protein